jgi:hypothetical protein
MQEMPTTTDTPEREGERERERERGDEELNELIQGEKLQSLSRGWMKNDEIACGWVAV